MTPELAAEKAADMLDLAADDIIHGDIVENRIAIADAWMRVHAALAAAPKTIEPAPFELGIDKILRRNEELKSWPRLDRTPALAMPINPDSPPIVRVASVDHKVVGWDFDRGIDGVGTSLHLKLRKI